MLIKEAVHPKDITTIDTYALNREAPIFIKPTLKGIDDHISPDTVIMEGWVFHWYI